MNQEPVNQCRLSGDIVQPVTLVTSPGGIQHLRFTLEHTSTVYEAGLPRQCSLRIKITASGDWVQNASTHLNVSDRVVVEGFLQRHELKDGTNILILHAQFIEKIN